MSVEQKLELFKLLVEMGFKEIEVGFPASSETEYLFVRKLVEGKLVPEDVTIQVLTQARLHIIERTFQSLAGADKVVINICNPTSPVQRDVVLKKNREETIRSALDSAQLIKSFKECSGIKALTLEYCPESFMATEPDFALEVCNAVIDLWRPKPDNEMIINLAATVEMSTPNIFADKVEWFCRNVHERETFIISVHTHNDRGTAVAAAELAVMAGADRVEGSLFGNGERGGNMDTVTMALNLFGQGVDPCLDITDIDRIVKIYTRCTGMAVPPRHPYAGELVFTAFSGSHQDAIRKALKEFEFSKQTNWNIPYLVIDPKDIGRSDSSIIRINSQSGKSGAAYVMEKEFGIILPHWFQPDFGRAVQSLAERWGKELAPANIVDCFQKEYLEYVFPYRLKKLYTRTNDGPEDARVGVTASIATPDKSILFDELGASVLEAFIIGLQKNIGIKIDIVEHEENSMLRGGDVLFAAYTAVKDETGRVSLGAGIDKSAALASVKSVLSAVNRILPKKNNPRKMLRKPLSERDIPVILKNT
jgi:2-isopropylmalate synthase